MPSGFLYFIPTPEAELVQGGRLRHDKLAAFGLELVLSDVSRVPDDCIVTNTPQGPGGASGVVLVPISHAEFVPQVPAYVGEGQRWERFSSGGGDVWLGVVDGEVPRPEHLVRKYLCPGYALPDNTGRAEWSVPVVRGQGDTYGTLPCDFDWSGGQSFEPGLKLRECYQELWDDSKRVWDAVYGEHEESETFLAGFVARALGVNYRLGPRELALLGMLGEPIFDRERLKQFACLVVDVPAVRELVSAKKKTTTSSLHGGPTSTPGGRGSTPDGGQAVES